MPENTPNAFDPAHIVQQATQAYQNSLKKASGEPWQTMQTVAPILQSFAATVEALYADPFRLMQRQMEFFQSQMALGASWMEYMMGKKPTPVISPESDDKRFAAEGWDSAFFDLLKQSYLLTSNWLMDTVKEAKGLKEEDRRRAEFFTRQFVSAISPSNFLGTNPEALSTALATNGQSLVDGFKNMLTDLQSGRISMTDYDQFRIGETIATTPGQVVFRNRLIELIQYSPTTPDVYKKPLLICPPWINHYYILDLQPKNSFIRHMVSQGFQVFVMSWKNPDASYRDVGFDDYITEGLNEAINATLNITGEDDLNAIGYCIGGTMLSIALSIMHQKKDNRVSSATFFTTLTNFKEAGEATIFTDEQTITALEAKMQRDGVLDGRDMAGMFSMLRENDLIWSFVVNNYLLGKQPFPFDILYWNDDSTRMPAKMHSWYLRNLYLENKLATPNALTVMGKQIDLTKLDMPMYMVTGESDHITPWKSCYEPFAKMASKEKRFILSKAGHVAGVVNPPTPAGKPVKRSFWAGEANVTNPEAWLRNQKETPDSWWLDYAPWLATRSGDKVKAPATAGNKDYKPICAAPGVYVKEK
jgi:polyhydroxyalkanoate synthase